MILISDKNFEKARKKYGIEASDKYGGGAFENEKAEDFEYVIVLISRHAGLIAHEAVHVANFIFKNICAKPDIENDEPYAYLVDGLLTT